MKKRFAPTITITLMLIASMLSACDGLVGAPPTITPTIAMPRLDATVTINPAPPTPISGDFSGLPFSGVNNPTAAAAPNESEVDPQGTPLTEARPVLVSIPGEDGGTLSGELYRTPLSPDGTPTFGVLIVSTRLEIADWGGFAVVLRDRGFTVLSVETRVPPLPGDFNAMVDALIAEAGVNSERIGVIGAQNGADIAFAGCAQDARCVTAVLLTPVDRTGLLANVSGFNPRALLVAASQDDPQAAQTAEALRLAVSGEALYQAFDDAGRGAQMLVNRPDMEGLIVDWLRRYLRST